MFVIHQGNALYHIYDTERARCLCGHVPGKLYRPQVTVVDPRARASEYCRRCLVAGGLFKDGIASVVVQAYNNAMMDIVARTREREMADARWNDRRRRYNVRCAELVRQFGNNLVHAGNFTVDMFGASARIKVADNDGMVYEVVVRASYNHNVLMEARNE